MTPAKERKAAERKRKREAGLVPLEVWVRPENIGEVQELAQLLRAIFEQGQRSQEVLDTSPS